MHDSNFYKKIDVNKKFFKNLNYFKCIYNVCEILENSYKRKISPICEDFEQCIYLNVSQKLSHSFKICFSWLCFQQKINKKVYILCEEVGEATEDVRRQDIRKLGTYLRKILQKKTVFA